MKRSAELTPLSHDHHQALFVAMQLKRAEPANGAAALRAFGEFVERIGDPHFRIEEEILLPGWLAVQGARDEAALPLASRVLAEHLEIRTAARAIDSREPDVEALRALGALLEAHVRFEERELFPLIEGSLDEPTIAALGAEIAAAEAGCDA